jgi:excisionase family DNA binding protein
MAKAHRLITISEAAQMLEVHRNTVRNWADRGIIRAVRLPGNGQRRFQVQEVERVREGYFAGVELPPQTKYLGTK